MSFLEYVNNIRLFHAVDDLLYTEKKITRIALDNGFPTTASFNKAFRDIYNMTPSAYRSSIRKEQAEEKKEDSGSREAVEERVQNSILPAGISVQDDVATKNCGVVRGGCEQNSPDFQKAGGRIIKYRKDRRASGQRHAASSFL